MSSPVFSFDLQLNTALWCTLQKVLNTRWVHMYYFLLYIGNNLKNILLNIKWLGFFNPSLNQAYFMCILQRVKTKSPANTFYKKFLMS